MSLSAAPQRSIWHGVVIGVDRYDQLEAGAQLAGCANDAEAFRHFLLEHVGVPESRIRCLTSPLGTPATGAGSAPATSDNVRGAFRELQDSPDLAPGDHVVLFYAGHGVRLTRGTTGIEHRYGFAPADTGRDVSGLTHLLLDRELHAFLRAIEQRRATATVIADTCHSGAALRGVAERPTTDTPRERYLAVAPLSEAAWEELGARHPALRDVPPTPPVVATRGGATVSGPYSAYAGGDFVLLAGCRDTQTSKEDADVVTAADGTSQRVPRGLMTRLLLKELARVPAAAIASLRWVDFAERLRNAVVARAAELRVSPQEPALEGRPEKPVFGGAWSPSTAAFVVRIDPDQSLRVDGGRLHGLGPGAVLAAYPPGTANLEAAAAPGVEVEIVSSTPTSSVARLRDAAAAVADGSPARLLRAGPSDAPIRVRLVDVAPAVASAAASRMESAGFTLTPWAEGAAPSPAHVEVRPWRGEVPATVWPVDEAASWAGARDGWVLVATDRDGAPSERSVPDPTPDDVLAYLPGAGPAVDGLPDRDRSLGRALAGGLEAWARHLRVRDHRGDPALRGMLGVKLRAGDTAPPADDAAAAGIAPLEAVDGAYVIAPEQWLLAEVRVLQDTRLRLELGLLGFSDDGQVIAFWPPEGTTPTFARGDVVHLGFDRFTPLQLTPRGDQRVSRWTLAVVAATGPTDRRPLNLHALEQPSVQETITRTLAADRAATRGALRGGQATRGAQPWVGPAELPAWYSWTMRVEVRTRPNDRATTG